MGEQRHRQRLKIIKFYNKTSLQINTSNSNSCMTVQLPLFFLMMKLVPKKISKISSGFKFKKFTFWVRLKLIQSNI